MSAVLTAGIPFYFGLAMKIPEEVVGLVDLIENRTGTKRK